MKKEFVPYELAVKLKTLGFDEPCFGWYQWGSLKKEYHPLKESSGNQSYMREEDCNAPTFSQVFRWFREDLTCDSWIRPNLLIDGPKIYQFLINDKLDDEWYETYEEAELACLTKLIEIVELKSE
jgi:hypothetical protein